MLSTTDTRNVTDGASRVEPRSSGSPFGPGAIHDRLDRQPARQLRTLVAACLRRDYIGLQRVALT
jgi:hypothetical protein